MVAARWVSPLRYPGGKGRMAPWLCNVFAGLESPMDIEVWVEPFGGGAGAALTALEFGLVPEAWIVESNPALAAFWALTTDPDDSAWLADKVDSCIPTVVLFEDCRQTVAAALDGEDVDRRSLGFAAFIVNRCSRSGMVLPNVGPIGGRAQSGRWDVTSRFNGPRLAERIARIGEFGGRFRIHHGDGIQFVEQFAGSGIEAEVFFFLDPPYLGVGNVLYAHGMTDADHVRLSTALRSSPAPWVLTYDAHPRVIELYPDCQIHWFQIPHTTNKRSVDVEYVVAPAGLRLPEGNPVGKGERGLVVSVPPYSASSAASSGVTAS